VVYKSEFIIKHSEDGKKYLSDIMDVEQDYADNEINGVKAETGTKDMGGGGDEPGQNNEINNPGIANGDKVGYKEERTNNQGFATEGAGDFIDGIKIIDGKVGGKIPVD
jgi:hypothetical protein